MIKNENFDMNRKAQKKNKFERYASYFYQKQKK